MTLQLPGQKWIRDVNVEDFDSQVLSISQQRTTIIAAATLRGTAR
jgi:hypothetical protein